ncbi:MAG: site-2 protease family protein [Puniceicoccales bacterium]|nr:site-2 protease family protein [Puniceicoccales bacterium]
MRVQVLQGIFIHYLWFLLALTVHEWGHAWVADRLGDATPRLTGRVTLNPLAHVSFLGTIIIPLAVFLFSPGFALIGWGCPVVINSDNFKHKKWGDILCSLAGPLLNLILGLLVLLLGFAIENSNRSLSHLCVVGAMVNVSLGLFNLIPIPPLDGAHVLKAVVGIRKEIFVEFSKKGGFVLLILINLSIFRYYFTMANRFLFDLYWQFCKFLFA